MAFKQVLIVETPREGYGVDQIRETMTVAEMIEFLEQFDGDTEIYTSHDNGYTYGGFQSWHFTERYVDENGHFEDDGEDY